MAGSLGTGATGPGGVAAAVLPVPPLLSFLALV